MALQGQPLPTPGTLDLSFNTGTGPDGPVYKVLPQGDGKIVIAGDFTSVAGTPRSGIARLNEDGSVDAGFDPGAGFDKRGSFSLLAQQSDDRIVVGGQFTKYNGVSRPGAVRINQDGSIDSSFNPPSSISGIIAMFPDMRTIPISPVVRLNPDGTFDPSFSRPAVFQSAGNTNFTGLQQAVVLSDGKLLALGGFMVSYPLGQIDYWRRLYRITFDGNVDASFSPITLGLLDTLSGYRSGLQLQPNSRVLLLDQGTVKRYTSDGAADPTFTSVQPDRPIQCLAVQPDAKIVVAGLFKTLAGLTRQGVARLNSDGTLDSTFDAGPGVDATDSGGYFPGVADIAVQRDSRILLAGTFLKVGGTQRPYIGRLFGGDLPSPPSIVVGPSNRTAMAEQTVQFTAVAAGNPTLSYQWFFDNVAISGATHATVILTNISAASQGQYSLIVSNSLGTAQSAPATLTIIPAMPPAILSQPQGAAVAEGTNVLFSVVATNFLPLTYQWRFNSALITNETNATLTLQNVHFTNAGIYSVVVSSEVRTVTSAGALLQVSPAHAVDPDFVVPQLPADSNPRGITALVVQPDGKVVVVGSFIQLGGLRRNRIARLNSDGSVDTSFDPGTGVGGGYFTGSPLNQTYLDVQTATVQRDGKILIGGRFTLVDSYTYSGLTRLNADGTVDRTFIATGVTEGPNNPAFLFEPKLAYVSGIVVQPDDKILITGPFHKVNDTPRNCIARLNPNGTLDSTFDPGIGLLPPANEFLENVNFHLALQPDGDVLVQGQFGRAYQPDTIRTGLARFKPNGALDNSFSPVFEPHDSPFSPGTLAVTSDGKILVAGTFTSVNGVEHPHLARLNPDGTLDSSFNPQPQPSWPLGVIAQPDGRVNVFGSFTNVSNVPRIGIARLNLDGSVDTSLNPRRGPDEGTGSLNAAVLTPAGEIVVAGNFHTFDGATRDGIALLYGQDPALPRLTGIRLADGSFYVRVRTLPNTTYYLEATGSLAPPKWTSVQTFTGDDTAKQLIVPLTPGQQYFRLRLE